MHGEDVRLKVHLLLETADGERLVEVRNEQVLRDTFAEHTLRSAEASLARALEAQVLSPARGLIRAHVHKLLERVSSRRLHPPAPANWPEESGVIAALNRKLTAVMAESATDAQEVHAAAR